MDTITVSSIYQGHIIYKKNWYINKSYLRLYLSSVLSMVFVSMLAREWLQLESANPEDKHSQLCIICLQKRDGTVEKEIEFIKWDHFISLNWLF